ncbi:uncharacterized protein LOC116776558 [Danaus plexippus]|uniref:Uncharacterized protein n=1 Tax=Danaus plexippus plexippus TaxID=278856 RepID=A0A212F2D2_DANPL|nr:uncharacterized protein LOC116776558 [Danaus plexippus]XP_032525659.1 uncharacterized protein LOC116776558 [Danaus plexippus]OWR47883.1 hypothetical protein KGM_203108 [Danaus plexippus plexippus]
MPYNAYLQITEEKYNLICNRFKEYMAHIDDLNIEPIKIFDPLSPKQNEELELIREVSKDLQKKKEEDVKKAAEAAAEAEKAAKENKVTEKDDSENTEENVTKDDKKQE